MPPPVNSPFCKAAVQGAQGSSVARRAHFWNQIARKYAAEPISDVAGYYATLRRVRAMLSVEHEVLEIGCGTGTTALQLAPFTKRTLATDFSEHMIAIAHEKLKTHPTPQLSFAVADAETPVFGQKEFDVVLAFNVLHLLGDLTSALEIAAQVLRPGGLFISKTACVSEISPLVRHLVLPLMRTIGKVPHVVIFNEEELKSAISSSGMEIISVERHGSQRKDIRVFITARKKC